MNLLVDLTPLKGKTAVIALSGGIDSVVLLHHLYQVNSNTDINIRAIHINHHLCTQSKQWAHFCQTLCQKLNINLTIIDIELADQKNIEKQARDKRYHALFSQLLPNEVLCTAHHQNDQAETILLQLLRGAGVMGLASMPSFHKNHYRPLLELSKSSIINYAKHHQLNWVEDQSNANQNFRRNFLRLSIIPALKTCFPSLNKTLARSAKHQAEALMLLSELAKNDIDNQQLLNQKGCLIIAQLIKLSVPRLHNVLRYYFNQHAIPNPSTKQLQQISQQLSTLTTDNQFLIEWSNYQLRQYQGVLYCLDNQNLSPPDCSMTQNLAKKTELEIRYNQSVKRVILTGKTHSQSLKKLYQEKKIPPWQRKKLPMYYKNEKLIAIAQLGFLSEKL